MKFVAAIRNLQAMIWLAVASPLLAQVAPSSLGVPEPADAAAQPRVPQIENAPVLTQEPLVNDPAEPTLIPPLPTPTPVPAPAPDPVPQPAPKKAKMDSLKPGQFVWDPRDSYDGRLKIVVVLDIQRIYVFHNDKLTGFSTISAGKKGKETPAGVFNILQKNIDHKSNLYSNAPMPYMQRLTWDGIALHGGHIPGYPASHGCIRLPHAFAKALYGATQMNQEVFVLKNINTPVKRREPIPEPVIVPSVEQPPVSEQREPMSDNPVPS